MLSREFRPLQGRVSALASGDGVPGGRHAAGRGFELVRSHGGTWLAGIEHSLLRTALAPAG